MKEIHKRVLTGICLAPPIVIIFYFLPARWFFLFMALAAAVAVFELVRMAGVYEKYLLTALILVGFIPLYQKLVSLYILCLLFTPAVYVFAVAARRRQRNDSINAEIMTAINTLFLGELFLVLPLYYFSLLKEIGASVPLILLFAVWASDTAAYICGKNFGKRPLAAQISPKKTFEGLAGAAAGSMIMIAAFHAPLRLGITEALLVGTGVGILGQTGDIFESIWKRVYKVKDSSGLIPGHGGILDRIDSFIFTAPFLYHYLAGIKI